MTKPKGKSITTKPYSIILPAHNEAEFIEGVLAAACGTNAEEIVVVDDGSTDATAEKVLVFCKKNKEKRLRLIRHEQNQGYGGAWKTGIRETRTRILVFFDSDIQTATPAKIEKLALPILEGRVDYVIGAFTNFGRITEYLARPLLNQFVPRLGRLKQPLSGLVGARREFLFPERMAKGYANLGVLLDAYFAGARIEEVDLGEIIHDKRLDEEKYQQAAQECRIFFERVIERRLRY
ncbi:MAG: Glycosyl transferase family 2 [Candidatus Jorgensenbacteria bacterium GW2011_GWA1_48_11]|uniref:Glycosyl transferase family 2 n=1 Tax=Candidatus Jorgensenbacteria bacterium GW2011_GWA1_48_11 TaxID=1618660 RepID=A0A0G1WL56_9BACT|nr:MAG: Glycosyl transferase family 2 [Candidatus Jorgensenbacteria bacterium GW2011_GWA1_48_11]KKW11816.1 MAG: Glycosyl transferase family 2 [Candidatus Jorgensenbacteria bacterium GW2011_GWB1_49_9]